MSGNSDMAFERKESNVIVSCLLLCQVLFPLVVLFSQQSLVVGRLNLLCQRVGGSLCVNGPTSVLFAWESNCSLGKENGDQAKEACILQSPSV